MQTPITHDRLLPRLKPGLTLLETPSARDTALHAVVIEALVDATGEALWIDARNNASTYVLNGVAATDRTLDALRIARAFTAYQHYALVTEAVRRAGPATALVVVPCVAALYRDDDLPDYRRSQLFESALALLSELATALSIPVLVTDPGSAADPASSDELGALVETHADHVIACEETAFGYRFETDEFQTTVYWGDGVWQTTIPYWVELLGAVDAYERADVGVETLHSYVVA